MHVAHRQPGYGLRLEWGLAGARALAPETDVAVVVDVLSFTTTVTVAVEAGIVVWPFPWGQDAAEFARARGAAVAVGRSAAGAGQVSLSPVTVATARDVRRLVLPSPNGATIAVELQACGVEVVAGCLRNAPSVARWLAARGRGRVVALVPAGELWPSGALRPAVEDLWGAGAVAAALRDLGWTDISPEAEAAAAAYGSVVGCLPGRLRACASGRELVQRGHGADVDLAAELDASDVVPLVTGEAFTAAT